MREKDKNKAVDFTDTEAISSVVLFLEILDLLCYD